MRIFIVGVAVLVLTAVASQGALARFTHQAAVGSNSFNTGFIDITITPTSALLTLDDMLPRASVTNSLVVTNAAGSAATRYAISSSATNADGKALKDQLVLTIKTIDVTTPGTPCNDFDGTQLYTGDLDSTAGKLVGDSTAGTHSGDRVLNASANETLCFRASLPIGTGDASEGAASTATFTFQAEQTANNS
jgi:hypothetical protein